MTFPNVQINILNLLSGESKEIERHALFIGVGETNKGKFFALTPDSDFDTIFGKSPTELKNQVYTAMVNAGQNWFAHVYIADESEFNIENIVNAAQSVGSFEYIVNTRTTNVQKTDVTKLQTLFSELMAKLGRRTFFIQAVAGINSDSRTGETWQQYVEKLTNLQKTVAADHVMLVPNLLGTDVGALAGRLASRAVSIGDSPARVKTGALLNVGATLPKDKDGVELTLAHLKELEKARFSTFMWYPDYDGFYWSDGRTLDVEGGDYQVIESVRVADKAARKVRLLAIGKIADRSFNSTLASTEQHKTYFAKPLRDMSKGTTIAGRFFPGECMPPQEDDIVITWHSKTKVTIFMKVRPYDCPKEIEVNIFLDLETLGGE